MLFSTIICLSAAVASVFAAPLANPEALAEVNAAAVTVAGHATTTTSSRTSTRTTTTKTKTKTTTTHHATTTTTPSLPKCTGEQTFNIKIRSLEDPNKNLLISPANGQFLVDIGGPAGFSKTATTHYTLTDTFITQTGGSGKIAVVKTTVAGTPHVGDIVFVKPSESIANGWSPLRCTGVNSGTLSCVANNNNRKVLQVCGKFVNMDPIRNGNCQDVIAFDVKKTCHL